MSVIEQVLERTAVPNTDVDRLLAEKKELLAHHANLLPIEYHLRAKIEMRVREIDRLGQQLVGAREHRAGQAPLPVLDQAVLRWRHQRKLHGIPVPRLALVDVGQTRMEFRAGLRFTSSQPEIISDSYDDVMDAMQRRRLNKDLSDLVVWFEYQGAIPSKARTLIQRERPNFEHTFLLIDAPRGAWQYQGEPLPKLVDLDPLILGFRRGALYLLGQFDPTPVERYIELEFTSRPALGAGQ